MKVNLSKREIELEAPMTVDEIYSAAKDLWVSKPEYAGVYFPFQRITKDTYQFVNNWKFADVQSHLKVAEGEIRTPKPERPLYPIAPSEIILYPKHYFQQPVLFSEVLRKIPPHVPMQAVRLKGMSDGSIELSVPGQWPNPEYEKDKAKHRAEVHEWVQDVMDYEHDLTLWKQVVEEKKKRQKGCPNCL